jgi:para-nitrobenzyl esterase
MIGATKAHQSLVSTVVRSLVIGLMAGCLTFLNTAAAEPLIATKQGFVRGLEAESVDIFLGIPYAAPPVGDLRWKPPQPHASWSGILSATKFGSHCAQTARVVGVSSSTEDCLFLNVYVPNGADDGETQSGNAEAEGSADLRGRAVMVWIHGGDLTAGESDDFDASRLASTGNVIVVTINYRLGVFGFLAHPALTAESPNHASGNYGILDQQLALKWVQQNIRAFGGDPGNVTVFGQSAGGLSALANMASPGGAGLFHKAIVQSGAYELILPTLATGESEGTTFAGNVGCTSQTVRCLRSLTVQQILANPIFVNPVVDGFVLPVSLQIAAATGQFNRVPVINGSNHDEARFMIAMNELAGQVVTAAGYPAAVLAEFGPQAGPLVLAQYPLGAYVNADEALAAIETDASFACPARLANQALSVYVPVFAYEFNDENAPEIFLPPVSYPYGAAHESELQYLFAAEDLTHLPGPPQPLRADQQKLSEMMILYWGQFAKKGDPNGPQTPNWAEYALSLDKFQSLAPLSIAPESDFASRHHCDFWAALFPQ